MAIHEDWRHVVTHLKALKPGTPRTVSDHLPPQARTFFERERQWCAKQAREIGPQCVQLIEQLLGDRIAERLRAAQGVLAPPTASPTPPRLHAFLEAPKAAQ